MFEIQGGYPLNGHIEAAGAKNSMQFVVTAALLSAEDSTINRIPLIRDIYVLREIITELNCPSSLDEKNSSITLSGRNMVSHVLPVVHASKVRSSILFIPALLRNFGKATIPPPGGDRIGQRPLSTHFYAIEKMGATIEETGHNYVISVDRLRPSKLILPYPSFTGTGLAIMLASIIDGTSIIENAALEPELDDLIGLLNRMGADIERSEGSGRSIIIDGSSSLSGGEIELMSDRLEIGSLLMAVAATSGESTVDLKDLVNLELLCSLLSDAGCDFSQNQEIMEMKVRKHLKAQSIETKPHPGFPTDLQPQFMALMTQASGISRITENMHDDRFLQVPYLREMGAGITTSDRLAEVMGPTILKGTRLIAEDIRGGTSLLLAALAASGRSQLDGLYHLERGYEDIYNRLVKLGARLDIVPQNRYH